MILSNNKIVLWTIVSHACIIIGAGHGVGPWFLLEIAYLWGLITEGFSLITVNFISISLLLCLIGQSLLVISIQSKKINRKRVFHFSGLLLLWANIIFYIISIWNDSYSHFLYISALPFFIITFSTFFLKPLKCVWKKVFEWL